MGSHDHDPSSASDGHFDHRRNIVYGGDIDSDRPGAQSRLSTPPAPSSADGLRQEPANPDALHSALLDIVLSQGVASPPLLGINEHAAEHADEHAGEHTDGHTDGHTHERTHGPTHEHAEDEFSESLDQKNTLPKKRVAWRSASEHFPRSETLSSPMSSSTLPFEGIMSPVPQDNELAPGAAIDRRLSTSPNSPPYFRAPRPDPDTGIFLQDLSERHPAVQSAPSDDTPANPRRYGRATINNRHYNASVNNSGDEGKHPGLGSGATTPQRPIRPVLRHNTSYGAASANNSDDEKPKNAVSVKAASSAKERAKHLADSISNSRRNSLTEEDEDSDEYFPEIKRGRGRQAAVMQREGRKSAEEEEERNTPKEKEEDGKQDGKQEESQAEKQKEKQKGKMWEKVRRRLKPVARRLTGRARAAPLKGDAARGDAVRGDAAKDDEAEPDAAKYDAAALEALALDDPAYACEQNIKSAHRAAAKLVHLQKGGRHSKFTVSAGPSPGSQTPMLSVDQSANEYVPAPTKYQMGIPLALLRLHTHDRDDTPSESTGPSSPATSSAQTPVDSPAASRRSSFSMTADSSGAATPTQQARPKSGRFGLHYQKHGGSNVSLKGMIKSAGSFVSDKTGRKARRRRREKEKIRITLHVADVSSRKTFIVKLCRALMMYGAPTHRLENFLIMTARVLEIKCYFVYIPGCMFIAFDDPGTQTGEMKLVRVVHGLDLGKLREVHGLYKGVVHDKMGVNEALTMLDSVMVRKPKYRKWMRVAAYGMAASSVAPFGFGARLKDLPVTFFLGCILGILQLLVVPGNDLFGHVFEVLAAVVTTLLARFFGSLNGGQSFCFSALAQSSLALILPGYTVLCSTLELQSGQMVAGSVRMVYAIIYTMFMGYGIAIGASIYGSMDATASSATHCTDSMDPRWNFVFVPTFTICLCVINQAKWRQMPIMVLTALAGYVVATVGSTYFPGNGQISSMLGALTVGMLANLYARSRPHVRRAALGAWAWLAHRVPMMWRAPSSNGSSARVHDPESGLPPPPPPPPAILTDAAGNPVQDADGNPAKDADGVGRARRPGAGGYGLAATVMLPAIFVLVPSGLASSGSLLAGVMVADQVNRGNGATGSGMAVGGTAFVILFNVVEIAIGITVGLFVSAMLVYLVKIRPKRGGLFSF